NLTGLHITQRGEQLGAHVSLCIPGPQCASAHLRHFWSRWLLVDISLKISGVGGRDVYNSPKNRLWCADRRAAVACACARTRHLGQDSRIREVLAVPCDEVVDPVRRSDRYVKSILRRLPRQASLSGDTLSQHICLSTEFY